MNLNERIAEKREQILKVAEKYGANNVRVFGSVARGDSGEKSDIDFLIQLDSSKLEGMRYFSVLEDMKEELELLLNCRVDIVEEKSLREKFKAEVLAEAIAL
ncbi:MAG: nucleotidyltransferase domain-containing protein [Candidatus Melainabacteria bacterium]|nr:nucleotidyltransferase domain-containing protein [Candidatus Melainabacteria bacterium]